MMPQAGKYLSYASIANVVAVVLAAFFGALTKLIPGLNGDGQILRKCVQEYLKAEKRPVTSGDYKALGSGIFMSFCLYLPGNVFGNIPILNVNLRITACTR